MPNTVSRATPDPHTPRFGEWVGQNRESHWLLPRAFPAGRIIDQRLRSRGFVKTITVRGSDARSIQLAINNAFGDILRVSAVSSARSSYAIANSPLADFLGLRQAWVPLRKLHKDSRLRFLAPAEMATPTLWDYAFLVSSVVMKATGVHRLYVTQPEAYLQDHPVGHQANETGWTWQSCASSAGYILTRRAAASTGMYPRPMPWRIAGHGTIGSTKLRLPLPTPRH